MKGTFCLKHSYTGQFELLETQWKTIPVIQACIEQERHKAQPRIQDDPSYEDGNDTDTGVDIGINHNAIDKVNFQFLTSNLMFFVSMQLKIFN